ncbi:MAG: hypothetical protein ACT4QC_08820 [Planctomycetaceae bacterium]
MPDPIQVVKALAAAAIVAALAPLLFRRPWRGARAELLSAGGAVAVGLGFLLGALVLGARLRWPPAEDQERLLLIVLPALLLVEWLGAVPQVPRWALWLLRLAFAAAMTRVLLHGTIYISDLAGPGTREWSSGKTLATCSGIGTLLFAAWVSLAAIERRSAELSLAIVACVAAVGSGLTIFFSGYFSGGLLGVTLAGALAGATLSAAISHSRPLPLAGAMRVGVGLLAALLVIGRFFGELPTGLALLLFSAPHLGWLCELPPMRRWRPWARGAIAIALSTVVVGAVVGLSARKFIAENVSSPGGGGPSAQDYLNLR